MQRLSDRFFRPFTTLLLSIKHYLQLKFQRSFLTDVTPFYLWSNKDFVLKIAPIHKRHRHLSIRSYPPPGYGTPPGKKKNSRKQPSKSYGLFLYPASISKSFLLLCLAIYSWLLPALLFSEQLTFSVGDGVTLAASVFLITFLTYKLTIYLVFHRMAPIFTEAWQLWPESQYDLFLTVPHVVKISPRKDAKITKHKYWHPDKQTSLSHQSSEYLEGMHTVQEVLLNLGIFELFFYKNDKSPSENNNNKDKDRDKDKSLSRNHNEHQSIKLNHWFKYYFWPVWVSYLIILGTIAVYQLDYFHAWNIPLFNFPDNIIVAAFIWLIWSLFFVWKRIEYLRLLHKDVKNGVYESHLELVPQKILPSITKIPDEQQIIAGINYLQRMLHIVQIAAFTNIMLILEVLPTYEQKLFETLNKCELHHAIQTF